MKASGPVHIAWLFCCIAAAVGCQPTVTLGSDRETEGGDSQLTSAATEPAARDTDAPTDPTAASASMGDSMTMTATSTTGGGPGTGTDSEDTGGSTTTDDATDSSSSGGFACMPIGSPETCLDCARSQCCDEVEFCLGQPDCSCFYECLQDIDSPSRCQGQCEDASGVSAVMTCLNMSCPQDCPSA